MRIEHYIVGALAGLAGFAANSAFAASASPAELAAVENEYAAAIEFAERMGRVLFDHDRAAAAATDVVIAEHPKEIAKKIQGWIETPAEDGLIRVLFYRREGAALLPSYVVNVKDGQASREDLYEFGEDSRFDPAELAKVRARELALRQSFVPCSKTYNTVTAAGLDGGHSIYLLAATTDPNLILFGGHYRVQIDAAGDNVLGIDKFTNSCLSMSRTPPDLPQGATLVALVVSQIVTPHPTEIHAWISLALGMDVYVVTPENKALWFVSGGDIQIKDRLKDKAKASLGLDEGGASEPAVFGAAASDDAARERCIHMLVTQGTEGGCNGALHEPIAAALGRVTSVGHVGPDQ